MVEPMSQCLAWGQYFCFFWFSQVKPKKQKNKMVEPMSQCLAWGQYFCFFWFSQVKPKKTKKQNGRTYVPVSGMGSVLLFFFLFFLVFPGKTKKTKKNKMAEPMSQCLACGQYFCFFCFFWFSQAKPKKTKKKNKMAEPMSQCLAWGQYFCFFFVFFGFRGFCNILVSDMGSAILFCLCFFVFVEVFAIFWYLTWVLPFCFFGFSRLLQYSAFPKKTLASFPKKIFFS